jgi:hypothetical protein
LDGDGLVGGVDIYPGCSNWLVIGWIGRGIVMNEIGRDGYDAAIYATNERFYGPISDSDLVMNT